MIGSALLLRRLITELGGIRAQLTRQGDLIEAWMQAAGVVIPARLQQGSPQDLRDTGPSFLDPVEQGIVEDYVARTTNDTGRAPTEDEVLSYLADEKTISLHARLKERAALLDLDRLGSRS